jgi:DNA transposition AAA+ family ATPase
MPQPPFGKVFDERLRAIEAEAVACGLNWTDICTEAGVSRATPDRWKKKKPNTITLIEKIEKVVEKRKKQLQRNSAQ